MRYGQMKMLCVVIVILGAVLLISCGHEGGSGESVPYPTVPTGLTATVVSTTRIDLSWDPPTGGNDMNFVSTFRIYRNGTLLSSSYALYIDAANINPGNRYCYTISAINNYGNESAQSAPMCMTTPLNWPRTYADSAFNAGGYSVQPSFDGGYIIAGYINTVGYDDASLIKTDSNGNIQWTKSYGYGSCESIQKTSDGGYIAACVINSWSCLLKIDENGNLVWEQNYNDGTAHTVRQTSDGGYVMVGELWTRYVSYVYPIYDEPYCPDIYLLKTDSSGNRVWSKTFAGQGDEYNYGYSVEQTSDGGYIIAGEKDSRYTANYNNIYLMKADSSGNLLWEKTYSGASRSIRKTSDGGYIITGAVDSRAYLLKTDSQGDVVWQGVLGGGTGGSDVQQTLDGGYIVVGSAGATGDIYSSHSDIYVVKTDLNGVVLWEKTYGGISNDFGKSIQQTSDGGYIIVGDTQQKINDYVSDVYLIRIDSNGNVQ